MIPENFGLYAENRRRVRLTLRAYDEKGKVYLIRKTFSASKYGNLKNAWAAAREERERLLQKECKSFQDSFYGVSNGTLKIRNGKLLGFGTYVDKYGRCFLNAYGNYDCEIAQSKRFSIDKKWSLENALREGIRWRMSIFQIEPPSDAEFQDMLAFLKNQLRERQLKRLPYLKGVKNEREK